MKREPLPMLRLFGVPHCEGRPGLTPKAILLAAALLFEFNGAAARTELAAFLYERAAPAEALSNLRQLLFKSRRWQAASEICLWTTDDSTVRIGASSLASDAAQFRAMHAVRSEADLIKLNSIWSGEFLEGLRHEVDSDRGPWVVQQRVAMTQHAEKLLANVPSYLNSALLETLLARLSHLSPYSKSAMLRRVENLAALDQTASAEAVFGEYIERIEKELGESVDATTIQAVRRISGYQVFPKAGRIEDTSTAPGLDSSRIPRVVLLPPRFGQSGRTAFELANGLIDDVVFHLCRLRAFAMLAPHTARQIVTGGDRISMPSSVDYLVTSRLFRQGSQLRLRFQLMRVRDQEIVFADEVRFHPSQLGGTRQVMAQTIASALSDGIAASELEGSVQHATPSAYVSYLKGLYALQQPDLASIRKARHNFEAAVRLQADYVPALSKIAHTLITEWLLLARPDRELIDRAKLAANSALDKDPSNPDALRAFGKALLYSGAIDESKFYIENAIIQDPNNADTIADAASLRIHLENFHMADNFISNAIKLNPFSPDRYLVIKGGALFMLGKYSNSLEILLGIKNQTTTHRLIAASAAMAGDRQTAEIHRQKWMDNYPDFKVADCAAVIPHKSRAALEHYTYALHMAGFG